MPTLCVVPLFFFFDFLQVSMCGSKDITPYLEGGELKKKLFQKVIRRVGVGFRA